MSVGRPLAKEEKEDRSLVSSPGFFQVPSLTETCMDTILSKEHTGQGRVDRQLLGPLYDTYKQFKQRKLKSLLEAILRGDPETTLELIDKYPVLLLEKLEGQLELNGVKIKGEVAEAPSGHKMTNTTAYRVVLAVEDIQLAKKIREPLVSLAGEEAAEAQRHEQFPEGWEAAEEKAWEPLFKQLDRVTQAIQDAAPGDIVSSGEPDYRLTVREGSNLDNALKQFRSLLDLKANEIITTGRLFNQRLLYRAYDTYCDRYLSSLSTIEGRNGLTLFLQQIIGYIQRSLPANYIQAFCDGYSNIERGHQSRSLTFRVYNGPIGGRYTPKAFYPLSESRLGFDFVLCMTQDCAYATRGLITEGCKGYFSRLLLLKESQYAEFIQQEDLKESARPRRLVIGL